eukprot:TRINITY_DN1352_c0_g3_i1.p1 TRINITY_DN1352_c0_g3~~TRINITY_DN1352_c0_g3_i1.p1  ORF type:complete len:213 (-),score=38.21 TRINITY_DN1352_c0_g3_i1:75-713(-)
MASLIEGRRMLIRRSGSGLRSGGLQKYVGRLFWADESSRATKATEPFHFMGSKARMTTLNSPPQTPPTLLPTSSPVNPPASTPLIRPKRPPIPPPPGSLEGKGNILTLSLLAVGLSGAGYYYYNDQIKPTLELSSRPPLVDRAPVPVVAEPPPVVLSAREELLLRKSKLEEELKELREVKKRDPLVDQRKAAIKAELKLIVNGIKQVEKSTR